MAVFVMHLLVETVFEPITHNTGLCVIILKTFSSGGIPFFKSDYT